MHNNTQEFIQNHQEIIVYAIVLIINGLLLILFASKDKADYRKKDESQSENARKTYVETWVRRGLKACIGGELIAMEGV